MFVKIIKQIQNQPLRPLAVANDPHGKLVAFYLEEKSRIYISSIIGFFNLFENYRQHYQKTKQYSLKQSLKAIQTIDNLRDMHNLQFIKFTHSIKEIQFLVISYFCSYVDLHSTLTGQKLHTIQTNKTLKHLNIYGHSIYLTFYNNELSCYEGKQLKVIKGQSVRFGYEKNKKSKKKDLIYQIGNSKLMIGDEIVEAHEDLNNSQEQFNHHENLNVQTEQCPFAISLCHRFMICSKMGKYRLRYKYQNWDSVYESDLKPYINHFSSSFQETLIASIGLSGKEIIITRKYEVIAIVKDLKHTILDIWWIGPKILLMLDKQKKITYIELNSSLF